MRDREMSGTAATRATAGLVMLTLALAAVGPAPVGAAPDRATETTALSRGSDTVPVSDALLGSDPLPVSDSRRTGPDRAAFIGKPTAPIRIGHVIAGTPAVGQPVTITLTVTPGTDLVGASLALRAADSLVVIDPVGAVSLGDLAANESAELVVTVLPLAAGTQYLGVSVEGTLAGLRQARNVTIAIRLPGAVEQDAAGASAGKSDETVRSFEAVETVR